MRSGLAPSDFHLFRLMDNQMKGKKFENEEELKSWINLFFALKKENFYKKGFAKMVPRWESAVKNKGEYVLD